ncbi:hypothetical protein F4813DRAFT_363843 [Daldinia decipiens]|uniref:uncharacterized protein n=1 Tax=Daldinia decipiens TaxID=326647 RepID=UPI0020C5840E|nr:uncharacterized protein F4813DRAFT_363843 [Daldinia decipiens]KAI1656626.1 hypothetical protein F4813DRAFT_363843 [Daldinia decipiens]
MHSRVRMSILGIFGYAALKMAFPPEQAGSQRDMWLLGRLITTATVIYSCQLVKALRLCIYIMSWLLQRKRKVNIMTCL